MANGIYNSHSYGIAMPQIYNTEGVNAAQWYYLDLYARLNNLYPDLCFAGTTTEYNACLEVDDCSGIDNRPDEGWMQLYEALNSPNDPRTYRLDLPFSTDMSWEHMKVNMP
jgi:hypothetical protein